MVCNFDHTALWVAYQIVTRTKLENRIVIVEQFIRIASECLKMNNFSSSYAIFSGLSQPSISRLSDSWAGVNADAKRTWESLKEIFRTDKNMGNIREAIKNSIVPCIPYIGVFLKDLTIISEKSQKESKGSGVVNFGAKSEQAEVISRIKQFQQSAFSYQTIPVLQQFLKR
jgi:hypothetical protein